MKVLITRPERDAAELKSRIEGLGAAVILAPLLRIEHLALNRDSFEGASALLVTSRNALRSLAASPALDDARRMQIFTVGPATAAMAHDLGFQTIVEGPGTAAGLAAEILQHPPRLSGPILHLAGDNLAFDMATALGPHAITVKIVPAYQSVAAETLPPDAADAINNDTLDAVVLMSPLTARTWAKLAGDLKPPADLANITHICMSAKVASALPPPLSPAVVIAKSPQIDEIVTLLYRLAGNTKNR